MRELPVPRSQGRAASTVRALAADRDLSGHADPDDPIGPHPQHPKDADAAAPETLERFRKSVRPQPRAAERFADIQPGALGRTAPPRRLKPLALRVRAGAQMIHRRQDSDAAPDLCAPWRSHQTDQGGKR